MVMSPLSDSKLTFAMPMENELRVTYPFANLYFTFPTKPYEGNSVIFPAYLKSIDDVVTPEYTPTKVFGRTDQIPTYKGTTRKITVAFDIPAYSEYDASEIFKKLNRLVKNLYPGYIENQGQKIINSPPLIRLKFANIINNPFRGNQGLLGYPDAITIKHNFSEIGTFVISDGQEEEGFVFAKAYSLSFGFTVLHEEIVGWDDKNKSANTEFDLTNFPYNRVRDQDVPILQKGGSLTSNLRGSISSSPAAAKGLTMALGGAIL